MVEQGWETVEQFYQISSMNQHASKETCRQLILHQKKVGEPIFIKIVESLGFTPNEIKKLLQEYGYSDFISLIGDHEGIKLTAEEENLLSVYRKLININPATTSLMVNIFNGLCKTAGINCSEELSRLRKK